MDTFFISVIKVKHQNKTIKNLPTKCYFHIIDKSILVVTVFPLGIVLFIIVV